MCYLYSVTKGQAAIQALFRVVHDRTGNLALMLGVFTRGRRRITPAGDEHAAMTRTILPRLHRSRTT
jgi:hypothetical protein